MILICFEGEGWNHLGMLGGMAGLFWSSGLGYCTAWSLENKTCIGRSTICIVLLLLTTIQLMEDI